MKVKINDEVLVVNEFIPSTFEGYYYKGNIFVDKPKRTFIIGSVTTSDNSCYLVVKDVLSEVVFYSLCLSVFFCSLFIIVTVVSPFFTENRDYISGIKFLDETIYENGEITVNIINGSVPCSVYAVVDGVKSEVITLDAKEVCEYLAIDLESGKYYEGTLVFDVEDEKFTFPISIGSSIKTEEEILDYDNDLSGRKVFK